MPVFELKRPVLVFPVRLIAWNRTSGFRDRLRSLFFVARLEAIV